MQAADQLHIERMTGTIGDDVAAQVGAQEGKIADQIENLVPRRLIGIAQRIVHRAVWAEDEQIGGAGPRSQTLAAQLGGLLLQNERPARGQLLQERAGREGLSVDLASDGRRQTVIEKITEIQLMLRR